MKNGTISSRASIVQRSKGQSAVEQSAYISRTSLYSDYYGMEELSRQVLRKLDGMTDKEVAMAGYLLFYFGKFLTYKID